MAFKMKGFSGFKQRNLERDIIHLEDNQDQSENKGVSQSELNAWDEAYGRAMQEVKLMIKDKNLNPSKGEGLDLINATKKKWNAAKPK